MIHIDIDLLTPCLKDLETGDMIETEVIRIKRKSFLQKFNRRTGWYTSWSELSKKNEIYALVIKGTVDIQGLLAFRYDRIMQVAFVVWMVAAPHNNPEIAGKKKYEGVGGHLLAIAAQRSEECGFDCELMGYAANAKLEKHYVEDLGAKRIHILHPYQILIPSECGHKIRETYNYEWTDDEL